MVKGVAMRKKKVTAFDVDVKLCAGCKANVNRRRKCISEMEYIRLSQTPSQSLDSCLDF